MRNIIYSIFVITLILIATGIVMIYSSSAIYAGETLGDSAFFLKKHISFVLVGFLLMLIMMAVNISTVERLSKVLFLVSVLFR